MTSSNGNIFRVTGPLCGEFTGPGEFPTQRPVTRSFDVYFDLRLNKRLCKQSWGWWFQTLLCPLWRHSNETESPICWLTPLTSPWGLRQSQWRLSRFRIWKLSQGAPTLTFKNQPVLATCGLSHKHRICTYMSVNDIRYYLTCKIWEHCITWSTDNLRYRCQYQG